MDFDRFELNCSYLIQVIMNNAQLYSKLYMEELIWTILMKESNDDGITSSNNLS